jgi:hypothetical protein
VRLAYRNWARIDREIWSAVVTNDEAFGLAGAVQFSRSHYETASPENIRIYIERGEGASGNVTVDVSTFNITGDCAMTAGTNYTALSETLRWEDREVGAKALVVGINSVPSSGLHLIGLQLTNASSGLRIKTPVAYIVIDDGGVNPSATIITDQTSNTGDIANIVASPDGGVSYPTYGSWTAPGEIVRGDIAGTIAAAAAGDLIYLRGGSYFDNRRASGQTNAGINVTDSGTSTAPITVMSYPGEIAHIDQRFTLNDDAAGGEGVGGFNLYSTASYLHFRNLRLSNMGGIGIYTNGTHSGIVVYGCHIYNVKASIEAAQGRDNVGCIRLDNCTDPIVANNYFHHTYAGQLTSNPIDGFPRGLAAGIHGYRPDRGWVHHNTIYNVRSCIQYKQSPTTPLNGYTAHHNYFYEFADYAFELNVQGSGQQMPQQNSFFRNVCESNHSYGCDAVAVPVSSPGEQSTGLFVYENTIIGCSWLLETYATDDIHVYSNNVDGSDRVWSIVDPNETSPYNSEITYNDYDNIYNITQAIGIYFIGRYEPGLVQLDSVTELQNFDQSTHAAIASTPDFANNNTETAPVYEDSANKDFRTTNFKESGYANRAQGIGRNVVGVPSVLDAHTDFFSMTLDGLDGAGRVGFYIDYSELTHTGEHVFYVARTHGSTGAVTVDYQSGGDDHVTVSGTLSWADQDLGIKKIIVYVPAKTDGDHRIWIRLSNPTGGLALQFGATHTIAYGVIDDGTIAPDSDAVFCDADAATNGSGTQASPYNSIHDAISNVGSKRYVYLRGTHTMDGTVRDGDGTNHDIIRVPATRSGEDTRVYVRNWPGYSITIQGDGVSTDQTAFWTGSASSTGGGESYCTYRGIDFLDLDSTNTSEQGGVYYEYGNSVGINIERCTARQFASHTNMGGFLLWGVDGAKVWRCTVDDIAVSGNQENANACGFQTYDGKNISVQRCRFSNLHAGIYHKRVATAGDVSTCARWNYFDDCEIEYGFSGASDAAHSYTIVQGNLFKGGASNDFLHYNTTNTAALGNGENWVFGNVWDGCGVGETAPVGRRIMFGVMILNNIMANCTGVWREQDDNSGVGGDIKYADYNHAYNISGTPYEWRATNYATAALLEAASGHEANATSGDPDFTDSANDDYTLGGLSNADGNGVDGTDHGIYLTGIEVVGPGDSIVPAHQEFFDISLPGLTEGGRLGFYIDYSERATAGEHTFYVIRTHGSYGPVTCEYQSGGDSHDTVSGLLSWGDDDIGLKKITVNVPTKTVNGDHRIWIKLSNPTGGAQLHLGDTFTIAYGVIDDGTIAADSDAIFFDTDAGTNGSGTQASPYDNIYDAIANVGSTRRYIYGQGTVTVDGTNTVTPFSQTADCITPPLNRTDESDRLYILQWPGQTNLVIQGEADSPGNNDVGFVSAANTRGSWITYRNVDFQNLDWSSNGWGGGIGGNYTSACMGVNVEHCTFDNLNGGSGDNVSAVMLWGSDGIKVWRSTANNIQVAGSTSNDNAGGMMLVYDGTHISIQRCEFSNTSAGYFHKRIETQGVDVTISGRFNKFDNCWVRLGYSGTSNPGHNFAIVQSCLFEGVTGRIWHDTRNNAAEGTKGGWFVNNVFDTCGSGEIGAIHLRMCNEAILFNNIMLDCRRVWGDYVDESGAGIDIEYADYNHAHGTTYGLPYEWRATDYASASALNTASGHEANASSGDPGFTDATNDDYTLGSPSAAVGQGVDGTDPGIYLTGIEPLGA